MLNKFICIGRLTRDPEANQTTSGVAVTKFTLAVNRSYNKDETDFINIVTWRKLAENCAKYISKGSLVAVEGSIRTGKYQNKEGHTVYTTDVHADTVQFLDTRRQQAEEDPFESDGIDIDDLPF